MDFDPNKCDHGTQAPNGRFEWDYCENCDPKRCKLAMVPVLPEAIARSEAFLVACDMTARERSVARLMMAGCSNLTIAHMIGLTEKTVKHHVSEVLDKSQTGSRSEVCSKAFGYDIADAKRLNAADPSAESLAHEHRRRKEQIRRKAS
jgi:DNA-binding CsgD family transcriptional regulator